MDRLLSSCGNHTDISPIIPKRPQADVINASPFHHCWHRWCFSFAEQPTVSQPEKREYTRVIGHIVDVFIFLVDGRFDKATDVATMFTCTLFSPHRICIVYTWVMSFSLSMTMLISFYLLWIFWWLYSCRQTRLNSQLNRVTHRCSGAYVFSSDNCNSRRERGEVASAWITEMYRGRANRGKHLLESSLP